MEPGRGAPPASAPRRTRREAPRIRRMPDHRRDRARGTRRKEYPVPDLNRCCRRERAVSWAARRTGPDICTCLRRMLRIIQQADAAPTRNTDRAFRTSAGVPGLEPRMDEPESPVLPITPYPSACSPRDANLPQQREIIYTQTLSPTNPSYVSATTPSAHHLPAAAGCGSPSQLRGFRRKTAGTK